MFSGVSNFFAQFAGLIGGLTAFFVLRKWKDGNLIAMLGTLLVGVTVYDLLSGNTIFNSLLNILRTIFGG